VQLPVGYELFIRQVGPNQLIGELRFWGVTIQTPSDTSHKNIMRLIEAHQEYLKSK
jgi:hypothetical protein